MRTLRFLILLLVFVSCLALATSSSTTAAGGMIFLQNGPNHHEINAGESAVYQWFIYNGRGAPFLLRITVSDTSGPGWTSEFDRSIMVLNPGASTLVNLTVKASDDVGSRYVNQTVFFSFENLTNPTDTFLDVGTANTKMTPVWSAIAPGKNKLLGLFESPLPAPLDGNYATFGLNLAIWAAIALFIAFAVDPALRLLTRRTKTDLDDRLLKVLHAPVFVLIIVFGLVRSFAILPLTEHEIGTVYQAYGVILIVVFTFIVYKFFKEIIIHFGRKWASRTHTEIDRVLIPVLDKVGGIVILVFGVSALLSYLHYNVTFLLAGVGVFGLVIAFAAQDALSNFFSGIALLLDRPFSEGDYITLPTGELCLVEKMGIRSCRLYDVSQNNSIVLPNNKLVNDKIVNMMEPDVKGVVEVTVSVVRGTDIAKVEEILAKVAKDDHDVLEETGREPAVRLSAFGESALEFKLYAWVSDFMAKGKVAHDLRKEIYRRFSEEGIEIAVPQRKVILQERKG